MLPLPRTRKRFAAPFFVFILGMTSLSFRMTPGGSPRERLKPRLSLVYPAFTAGSCRPRLCFSGLCCNLFLGLRLVGLGLFRLDLRLDRRRLLLRRQHHHHLPALETRE